MRKRRVKIGKVRFEDSEKLGLVERKTVCVKEGTGALK